MAAFMLIAMVVLFALGVPVAIAIAAASMGGIAFFTPLPLLDAAQKLMSSSDSFMPSSPCPRVSMNRSRPCTGSDGSRIPRSST